MATEADMAAYANNGRDWDGLCQALVWNWCDQFGSAPVTYASAIDAYYASPIASYDAYSVPPGGVVFYDIGSYGHVSVAVDDGEGMASSHVQEFWGINAGRADSIATYVSITGATPLGWSWQDGANSFPYESGGGGGSTDYGWGLTSDCQLALQQAMNVNGPPYYTGPADGAFGANSVAGMQQWLKDLGYLPADYTVDGIPGLNYGTALQELARDQGVPPYTGPIDGDPGENTSVSLTGWAQVQLEPDPDPDPPDPVLPAVPAGTLFGVDVGTSQAGFDFAAYQAAGGGPVLVKMGGANASDSPYTAPEYTAQLAAARAVGCPVAHYWFNGRENGLTPTSSAQYFAEHADVAEGDIVALDVEDEGDAPHWSPAEVAEYVTALDALAPGIRVLVYMNASVEAGDDWSQVVAAGHPLWIAAWGANDGAAGTPPALTHWTDWAVWQFTSVAGPIPGWADDSLDGNAVREDTWPIYGWTPADPDPDPDPEPGAGADEELRSLLGGYFTDAAQLAGKYRDDVAALPVTSEASPRRFER